MTVPTDPPTLLYETSFSPSANAPPYTLQIYLSPTFPSTPPIITLTRPALATHRILNENMQCAYLDSLSQWGEGGNGIALVAVIEEIAGKLISSPPTIVGGSAQPTPPPPSYNNVNPRQTDVADSRRNSDPTFHMPIPPVPSSFPDLEMMNDASLRRLIEDDVSSIISIFFFRKA